MARINSSQEWRSAPDWMAGPWHSRRRQGVKESRAGAQGALRSAPGPSHHVARARNRYYRREPFLSRRPRGEFAGCGRAFVPQGGCHSSCSNASSSLMARSGLDSDLSRTKTSHDVSRSSTCTAVIDAQRGLARWRRKRVTAKRRAHAAAGKSCGIGPDPPGRAMRLITTEVGSLALDRFVMKVPLAERLEKPVGLPGAISGATRGRFQAVSIRFCPLCTYVRA
jgi:hypothetical protein